MSVEAVTLCNQRGRSPLVLTCEHASAHIPLPYAQLGLSPAEVDDHIGWDIGAASVTQELSRLLDAPAVLSFASRLLVDCNRQLTDADLMPSVSHGVVIPGNAGIDAGERRQRLASYYEPYHAAIDRLLQSRSTTLLLSVHSFTPKLNGCDRAFEIGVLFDDFTAEADRLAAALTEHGFSVRMNEPYSGLDGLIFSARTHGQAHGVVYLELEVNNGLLRGDAAAQAVARRLAPAVAAFHATVRPS